MAIKICPHCQMPFSQQRNEEICPNCAREGETQFQLIKEYLYAHPGASATELVQQVGVTMRQIQHYLREDRLSVVGEGFTGLTCDLCGKAIKTGRYCELCEKDVAARKKQEFQQAALRDVKAMKVERALGGAGEGSGSGEAGQKGKNVSPKKTGLRFRDDGGSSGRRRK